MRDLLLLVTLFGPGFRPHPHNDQLYPGVNKNHEYKNENLITGDELMKMACDKINEIQLIVGGSIVYIECEDV